MAALQKSIAHAVRALGDVEVQGVLCKTENSVALKCYVVLSSNVADVSETEDLILLKRGTQTNSPYYRCLATRAEQSRLTRSAIRNNLLKKRWFCGTGKRDEKRAFQREFYALHAASTSYLPSLLELNTEMISMRYSD